MSYDYEAYATYEADELIAMARAVKQGGGDIDTLIELLGGRYRLQDVGPVVASRAPRNTKLTSHLMRPAAPASPWSEAQEANRERLQQYRQPQ
jgi:hypothetical protein